MKETTGTYNLRAEKSMNLILDFSSLLNGTILLFASWTIKLLYAIIKRLNILNGRVVKTEMWQVAHDKQDDERHFEITSKINNLEERQ